MPQPSQFASFPPATQSRPSEHTDAKTAPGSPLQTSPLPTNLTSSAELSIGKPLTKDKRLPLPDVLSIGPPPLPEGSTLDPSSPTDIDPEADALPLDMPDSTDAEPLLDVLSRPLPLSKGDALPLVMPGSMDDDPLPGVPSRSLPVPETGVLPLEMPDSAGNELPLDVLSRPLPFSDCDALPLDAPLPDAPTLLPVVQVFPLGISTLDDDDDDDPLPAVGADEPPELTVSGALPLEVSTLGALPEPDAEDLLPL